MRLTVNTKVNEMKKKIMRFKSPYCVSVRNVRYVSQSDYYSKTLSFAPRLHTIKFNKRELKAMPESSYIVLAMLACQFEDILYIFTIKTVFQ